MEQHRYSLVILGPGRDQFEAIVASKIRAAIRGIGLDPAVDLAIVDADQPGNFSEFEGLTVGLWFGGEASPEPGDLELLARLQETGAPVLPLVADITRFTALIPPELRPINGRQWDDDRIPDDVLRGLRLTRRFRQAFISYRRTDSTNVAVAIFNALCQRGFEVFLDSASVDAAEPFQDVLWDRMADMDLLVLLDSPNALTSRWVNEELVQVNNLGLGVLQLIWPGHTPYRETHLSIPLQLTANDFVGADFGPDGRLTDDAITRVTAKAEEVRIESLAARRTRVVGEFVALLPASMKAEVQVAGPIILRAADSDPGAEPAGLVLPVVGLPDAYSLQREQSGFAKLHIPLVSPGAAPEKLDIETLVKQGRIRVVYDGLGVRAENLQHLVWLNGFLPLKTVSIDRQVASASGGAVAGLAPSSLRQWLEGVTPGQPGAGGALV